MKKFLILSSVLFSGFAFPKALEPFNYSDLDAETFTSVVKEARNEIEKELGTESLLLMVHAAKTEKKGACLGKSEFRIFLNNWKEEAKEPTKYGSVDFIAVEKDKTCSYKLEAKTGLFKEFSGAILGTHPLTDVKEFKNVKLSLKSAIETIQKSNAGFVADSSLRVLSFLQPASRDKILFHISGKDKIGPVDIYIDAVTGEIIP